VDARRYIDVECLRQSAKIRCAIVQQLLCGYMNSVDAGDGEDEGALTRRGAIANVTR